MSDPIGEVSSAGMIEASTVERPRGMVQPFAALAAKLQAAGFTVVDDEPGEAYMPHRQFELEYQRRGDGSSRFEDPTACEGQMRVMDKQGASWSLRCDACDEEWTVRVPAGRIAEYLLSRAGVPERFAGKKMDSSDAEQAPTLAACRAWLRDFKRGAVPAPALWGQVGRGKSHLLSLMVETVIRMHSVEAVYRSWIPLMNELRDAIAAGAFAGTYSRMLTVPVLALDDLGAGRMTDASREWLASVVDGRYGAGLPLLVATNVPPAGWADVFGDRAASRLRGGCVALRLEGSDRRAQGTQEALALP